MPSNFIRRLQQATHDTSPGEALAKLMITLLFVPVPIVVGSLVGFWLDYYKLNTLPLLLVTGTLLGTLASFFGVYRIIIYSHKEGLNE